MFFKSRLLAYNVHLGFSLGLYLAVVAIFFIDKGVDLWLLGVVLGAGSVVTAVMELPLGSLADQYGRLRIFRIGLGLVIIALAPLAFSNSLLIFILSAMLNGIARALHSGSVDAWYVQELHARGAADKVERYAGHMSAALCIGVAAGASVGGYIPAAMPDLGAISGTEWNPIFAAFSALVLLLLSYGLFYEGENHDQQPDRNPVAGPLRQTLVQSAQNPFVLELLITMSMAGLALVAVEFFWQPRLRQIVPDISYAVFGWMTAGYFIMGALGSVLIGPLAKALRLSPTAQVRIMPVFLLAALLALGWANHAAGFVLLYLGFMLLYAMLYPAVFTQTNRFAHNQNRSTMQSLISLSFRFGSGMIVALTFVLQSISISALWLGIALFGLVLIIGKNLYMRRYAEPEIEASD